MSSQGIACSGGDMGTPELQSNDAATTATKPLEPEDIEDGGDTHEGHWLRENLVRSFKSLLSWLWGEPRKMPQECCIRTIEVLHTIDRGDSRIGLARALFDTGSKYNFVSEGWLERRCNSPTFDRLPKDSPHQVNWHGGGKSKILGEKELLWYGDDEPYTGQIVHLKMGTMSDKFLVVADGQFDVIIGLDSIQEKGLFKNEWFPCFANQTQGGTVPRRTPLSPEEKKGYKEQQKKDKDAQQEAKKQPRK